VSVKIFFKFPPVIASEAWQSLPDNQRLLIDEIARSLRSSR
jgi:hypothetical protein